LGKVVMSLFHKIKQVESILEARNPLQVRCDRQTLWWKRIKVLCAMATNRGDEVR